MIDSLIPMFIKSDVIPTKFTNDIRTTTYTEDRYVSNSIYSSLKHTSSQQNIGQIKLIQHNNFHSGEYTNLFNRLYGFLSLEQDWDGYGGQVPNKGMIDAGEKLINKLKASLIFPPNVMLSGSGEIGFYWEKNTRYAELTFDDLSNYTFVYIDGTNSYNEEYQAIDKPFSHEVMKFISTFA